MKLLYFALLLPFLGLAQSQEKEFIQQLEKDRFISKFEAYRVSPDSVIESLYDVYLARFGYSRTQRDLLSSSWSYYSTEEDPALKQRKLLLKHLREFGIIPKEICADLYKKTTFESNIKPTNGSSSIPSNVIIRSELEILQYLYEWRLLQKQKSLLPNYILKLDSLGFIKNIKSVDFSTINGHDDILKYFKHHIVIKEEELPDSYGDAYQYAYEKLLLLDSSFMITDFKYSYEEKEEEYYTSKIDRISFKHKGRTIMQGYRHNDKDSKYDLDEPMIDKNFAHILNLGLINADAPYRIVELNSGNSKEINLVLVNEEQAAFINYDYSSYDYTYFKPNEFQIKAYSSTLFKYLKINEIDYFLGVYDSLGFYKNYTKHQKDSIFENTRSYFQESSESVFYNTTTNHLYFDWEMYDTETPYITACKDFAAATMGDFTPTNINDQFDFDREFGKFEFEFKGKRYYTKVEISGDWYDGAFLELINKAMEEHHLPGKFYDLPDGGQSSGHVYLTPGQYQYLLDNKMIMFFDPSYFDK